MGIMDKDGTDFHIKGDIHDISHMFHDQRRVTTIFVAGNGEPEIVPEGLGSLEMLCCTPLGLLGP